MTLHSSSYPLRWHFSSDLHSANAAPGTELKAEPHDKPLVVFYEAIAGRA